MVPLFPEQFKEIHSLLKSLLIDEALTVRYQAAEAVSEMAKYVPPEEIKKILPLLKEWLADDQPKDVRFTAAKVVRDVAKMVSLSLEEVKEILSLVKPLLADDALGVRYEAARVVSKMVRNVPPEEVKEILPILKEWLVDNQPEDVRSAAAKVVSEMAKYVPPEEIKKILQILKEWLADDQPKDVRFAAVGVVRDVAKMVSLSLEEVKEILPLLKSLLADDALGVRSAAAKVVSEMVRNVPPEEVKEILPILKEWLADKALKEVMSTLLLDLVADLLKDPTAELRAIAKKEIIKRLAKNKTGDNKQDVAKEDNNEQLDSDQEKNKNLEESFEQSEHKILALTYQDVAALAKLIADTKGSTDTDDKAIHDGAGKVLQELAATLDNTSLVWLNEHFAELPNLPELLAFLKTICHKTLSDGKIEAAEAEFLANCVVKKGITATFELNEKVVIFEDARYFISEGAEYLEKIAEQAIETAADEIAKQYKEHVPMFVNSETVLDKAATDIKDVSIVDGNPLKNNAWKISLLHRSNHEKALPSEVFVLLERSSYTGEHITKKVVFDKASGKLVLEKEYTVHPYRADVLREEIFGKMEYNMAEGKVRYYGSIYEMELSVDASSKLIEDIKSGKLAVSNVSDSNSSNGYNVLHQFVIGLLSAKSSASELTEAWDKYVAHLGTPSNVTGAVQEFNKMQLLKTDSKQFYVEEYMAEVSSHMGKTDKRLENLEKAQQEFYKIKQKIKTNDKINQKDKEIMNKQIISIESKLQSLADKKDLETITLELTKLINEGKFTKGRLADLEELVDELATCQDKTNERQDKLQEDLEQGISNINKEQEKTKETLSKLGERVDNNEEKLEDLHKIFDKIKSKIEKSGSIDKEKKDVLLSRLDNIEKQIIKLEGSDAKISKDIIDGLEGIKFVQYSLSDEFDTKLAKIENEVKIALESNKQQKIERNNNSISDGTDLSLEHLCFTVENNDGVDTLGQS